VLPWGLVVVLLAGVGLGVGLGLSEAPVTIVTAANAFVNGRISAPGGPFLRDSYGRVVILHGVNAVYKHPPFELYDDPGKPWDFSPADAARIASLGFDVVRLGIVWSGLEPGEAGPNDPAICTPGTPNGTERLDTSVDDAYLARLKRTVELLGRYHVYTLLDMHQDLYSQALGGEGAPSWAVCTDGLPAEHPPGRWSRAYSTPAVQAAFENFWNNDVVGDLQGRYDQAWSVVAAYFAHEPWILGYDPFNEPFAQSVLDTGHHELDAQIECFYTGTAHPGIALDTRRTVSCPGDDPAEGLIPTILKADPHHLIFYEPDIFSKRGAPNYVGAMDLPNLVLNFHDYCGERSPVTGNPTDLRACASHELRTMSRRAEDLNGLGSRAQPGGPALFMSEFGATSSTALLDDVTAGADLHLLGWIYWAWKYYDDPTGSSDEALVGPGGKLKATASALSQTYAQAVAGTPTRMTFDPATGAFGLTYRANDRIQAPTVIFVPVVRHYPHGYCANASGASIASPPDAVHLEIVNTAPAHTVSVRVRAGACTGRSG
jgi:endoglycosylceramidase